MKQPENYQEFHYEAAIICMNDEHQAIVTQPHIGATHMYHVAIVKRDTVSTREEVDGIEYTAPRKQTISAGSFHSFGTALRTARAICGWGTLYEN